MPTFASQSLPAKELLDRYFLENRARLLEVAAFLDRLDRCPDASAARQDFRYRAFVHAIDRLRQDEAGRTRDVQVLFSDPTSAPLPAAGEQKNAAGAWPGVVR